MKKRTAELDGAELDYAVAIALGSYEKVVLRDTHCWVKDTGPGLIPWEPSEDWSQGGPIIERKHISLISLAPWRGDEEEWSAAIHVSTDDAGVDCFEHEQLGRTVLVAAMRCFVSSGLGEEVDIP